MRQGKAESRQIPGGLSRARSAPGGCCSDSAGKQRHKLFPPSGPAPARRIHTGGRVRVPPHGPPRDPKRGSTPEPEKGSRGALGRGGSSRVAPAHPAVAPRHQPGARRWGSPGDGLGHRPPRSGPAAAAQRSARWRLRAAPAPQAPRAAKRAEPDSAVAGSLAVLPAPRARQTCRGAPLPQAAGATGPRPHGTGSAARCARPAPASGSATKRTRGRALRMRELTTTRFPAPAHYSCAGGTE